MVMENDVNMLYAAIALALLTGIAGGAVYARWRMRASLRKKARRQPGKTVRSRADDEEIYRYKMAINAMNKLTDAGRYEEAYAVARNWCNRAPQFVDSWTKLKGAFNLKKLPPVEYASQHMVAQRNITGLRRLREVLNGCDELKPWQNLLADEIVAAKELERIFELVERNPGIVQEAAARRVDASIRRAIGALHDADLRHMIRRERSGGSYALYLR